MHHSNAPSARPCNAQEDSDACRAEAAQALKAVLRREVGVRHALECHALPVALQALLDTSLAVRTAACDAIGEGCLHQMWRPALAELRGAEDQPAALVILDFTRREVAAGQAAAQGEASTAQAHFDAAVSGFRLLGKLAHARLHSPSRLLSHAQIYIRVCIDRYD